MSPKQLCFTSCSGSAVFVIEHKEIHSQLYTRNKITFVQLNQCVTAFNIYKGIVCTLQEIRAITGRFAFCVCARHPTEDGNSLLWLLCPGKQIQNSKQPWQMQRKISRE